METAPYVSNPIAYAANLADDGAWLRQRVDAFWALPENQDMECVDNHRIALVGVLSEEAAYDFVRDGGCCGSFDTVMGPSPMGRSYRYGFNYGH